MMVMSDRKKKEGNLLIYCKIMVLGVMGEVGNGEGLSIVKIK
jgi:hypothetical protein